MFESNLVERSDAGNVRVFASTELVMSIVGKYGDADKLSSSPSEYIYEVSGAESSADVSVEVVYNTSDSVNLILPYYALLERGERLGLSDSDMEGVSGGVGFPRGFGDDLERAGMNSSSYGARVSSSYSTNRPSQPKISSGK